MRRRTPIFLLVLCFLMCAAVALASTTGSITGIVTDASGAVVPNASVTATNEATGVAQTLQTDAAGFYNFPNLEVGNYDLTVEIKGFKSYTQKAIRIDANTVFRADVKLELGEVSEKITVESDAVQVETQSTQMGEVIGAQRIEAVPLNGRSFIELLSLQPGVVPNGDSNQGAEMGDRPVGGQSPGNISVNGGREASNGFIVNGANVNEGKNNGTSVIPNLDSIEEFRIITNNFDAEYGNYSGGQVNLVTKSGSNTYHGEVFEFNRNTAFNARNYFAPSIPKLIQNQFGGTFGGPIKRDKLFFFLDYQGTRLINGDTVLTNVPSVQDRTGDLSDQTAGIAMSGAVSSDSLSNPTSWANTLSSRLGGQPIQPGEPYYFPGCGSTDPTTGCVFPTQTIPMTAWSSAAKGLLQYFPQPNQTNPLLPGNYSNSSLNDVLRDDKAGLRTDYNSNYGLFSFYWHIDDTNDNTAYGGSNLPGFGAGNLQRAQVFVLGNTKSFGSTEVNELRFSYTRSANQLQQPEGGLGVSLTSLGFPGGFGPDGGIGPINPALEGVPSVSLGLLGATIGVPPDTTKQYNNMFQVQDNFTKVIGTHSIKFGGQFHYDQINDRNYYGENGQFTFDGSETGSDFADFLLGTPDGFIQASVQRLDSRSKYMGLFAEDSWRITPNLTLNYGLRWEFSNPWYDTQNKIETIKLGEQSKVFPGAPEGYLVPGDPGIPSTLAPTQYHNFSPRLGIAYSPSVDSGLLGKITGGPGKMSIRAGFGMFYTSVEDLSQFQEIGDPPYGLFYSPAIPSTFETPYVNRLTGQVVGQPFPFQYPPTGASQKNPDTTFDWANVEPLTYALAYKTTNVTPYTESYELSIERQIGSRSVLSVSYVGNQGHHLISEIESNPANQQLCLQLSALGATPDCAGGFAESSQFTLPNGVDYPSAATANVELVPATQCGTAAPGNPCVVNSTFTKFGPAFGNNPWEATIAHSSYNSLQASFKHTSGLSSFLLGYTYSKCRDNASGLEEGVNPFDPSLSTALCAFNVTNNFVASYELQVPIDRLFHVTSGVKYMLAGGWSFSGITTFATGLPISLSEPDDNSLTGTYNSEAPIDVPNYVPTNGGPLLQDTNPRHGNNYFNTNLFEPEDPGTIGDAKRRFFSGPGINNWDMALLKNTKFTESKSLELRFETFNTWNHTQFGNPGGTLGAGNFGLVQSAAGARVLQVGAKFHF
jgi:hypothetical protein